MAGEGWVEATWNGQEGWLWEGKIFIPFGVDPTTGPTDAVAAFFAPPGGRAAVKAVAKGDPGPPPILRKAIPMEIPWDAPAPGPSDFDLVIPSVDGSPATWDFTYVARQGQPGDPGDMGFMDLNDLAGTPASGYYPAYTPGAGGADPTMTWTAPKVGGRYWPTVLANTSGANGQLRTIAQQQIPALPFAWYPRISAYTIVTGTLNTRPRLLARLGEPDTGDIVGSDIWVPGTATQKMVLQSGVPAGSPADHGRVAKDVGPTVVYLRLEEQATTADNFTTSASTTWFFVEAVAL